MNPESAGSSRCWPCSRRWRERAAWPCCPRGDVTIPIPAFGFKVPCPLTLLGLAGAYLFVAVAIYADARTIIDVVYRAALITVGYYVST